MLLKKLELINFRNFEKLKLNFSPVVLIIGNNGRGKTNILESIYILATTRSFRTAYNSQLINFDADFARMVGQGIIASKKQKIEIILNKDPQRQFQKKAKINQTIKKLIDVLGILKVVLFSPETIEIITGSPQERRRFLDITLTITSKKYAQALANLFKIIQNRNHILSKIGQKQGNIDEIGFWDKGLIQTSAQLIFQRFGLINFYNQRLSEIYQKIGGKGILKIKYRNTCLDRIKKNNADITEDLITQTLHSLIKEKREQEIQKETTLIGPQRDELIFSLSGRNLGYFGSRGEARSAVLSAKISESEYLQKAGEGDRPILLLDDVFSELDKTRRNNIINVFSQNQVFITTTDKHNIDEKILTKAQIIKL